MDSWQTLSVEVTAGGALTSREERGSRRVPKTQRWFNDVNHCCNSGVECPELDEMCSRCGVLGCEARRLFQDHVPAAISSPIVENTLGLPLSRQPQLCCC
ncbi:hypothetical protein J6590_098094 [Homalodisca vitripennis]|nr:hypothetical protein J6590_098094 [Homalodisca vitripennis]